MHDEGTQEVRLWVDYSLTREKYFIYIRVDNQRFEVQLPFERQYEAEAVIDQLIASLMVVGFTQKGGECLAH